MWHLFSWHFDSLRYTLYSILLITWCSQNTPSSRGGYSRLEARRWKRSAGTSGFPSLSLSLSSNILSTHSRMVQFVRSCVDQRPARETSETARGREWERFWCLRIHTYLRETVTTRPPVRSRSISLGGRGGGRERETERGGSGRGQTGSVSWNLKTSLP